MAKNLFQSRRVLALAAIAGIVLHLGGAADAQRAAGSAVPRAADAATVLHVLNRIGFGPRPGDIERVRAAGLAAYIDQQLQPARFSNEALRARLAEFTTLGMTTAELAEKYYVPALQARRERDRREAQAASQPGAARSAGSTASGTEMMATPPATQKPPTPEERQAQAAQAVVLNELTQAKVLRATTSEAQLEEVLVDFWFNHFNVFAGKGQVRQYVTAYERDAIRPHVLGSFREMLGATAHHPAMLFYLDNFQSQAPAGAATLAPNVDDLRNRLNPQRPGQQVNPRRPGQTGTARPGQTRPGQVRPGQQLPAQPQRPARGLNENYARELMELHTLGVDGGYAQKDVIEVARVLTGWTIDRPQMGGSFVFRPGMHDTGAKTVLGVSFPAGQGEAEGERLLDLLASHRNTAKHIAFKLAQRFVADEPPAELVNRVAKVFLDTKGDLRAVTRAVITSEEFFAEDYRGAKVKSPFEFVVSAARATDATIANAQTVVQAMRDLGMPLYGCQPPTGYSMTADAWVNTGALLNRMNFGLQLVSGGIAIRAPGTPAVGPNGQPRQQAAQRAARAAEMGGERARAGLRQRGPIQVDIARLAPDLGEASRNALIDSWLAGQASEGTRQTLARATSPEQLVALALGSPEFQKR